MPDDLVSIGSLSRGKRSTQKPLKVLLIDPAEICWGGSSRAGSQPVNASLLALFSYLRQGGVDDVSILDLTLEPITYPASIDDVPAFEERVASILATYEYDVAAISCFSTFQFQSAFAVARASRRVRPEATHVVGGWHSLSEPQDFVTDDQLFDFVVSGSGERPLLAIAQQELRKTPGQPKILRQAQLTPEEHAALKYRVREYMQAAPRRYDEHFATGKQAFLSISRGCPHKCVFCAASYEQAKWDALPIDKCLELVEENRQALPGLECCYFGDALFGANTKWRHQMLEALVDHYPSMPFALITRSDLLGPRDFELLSEMRAMVVLGVESLSVDMLKIMNKTPNPQRYIERTLEVVEQLGLNGVLHEVFVILDHPGESERTLSQTCENLEKVLGIGSSISTFRYMHFPQFVRDYEQNQQRYGTEFRGPLRWWQEPRFWTPRELQSYYVASKDDGESFEHAKARLDAAVTRAMSTFAPFYRTATHGEIIGQML